MLAVRDRLLLGVIRNDKCAFEMYQQSLVLGNINPIVQFKLGVFHAFGKDVAMDHLEARRIYMLASAQGHARATQYLNSLDAKIRT